MIVGIFKKWEKLHEVPVYIEKGPVYQFRKSEGRKTSSRGTRFKYEANAIRMAIYFLMLFGIDYSEKALAELYRKNKSLYKGFV